MTPPIPLIVAAFVALDGLAVALIVVFILKRKKRREAWRKAAADLGLAYYQKSDDLLGQYKHLKLLQKGRARKFSNVIVGDDGDVQITLGDFRYTTGSGDSSHTYQQTICILQADALRLPHCFLRPQVRFFDFLGKLCGGQDLDFDDDPQFSAAYVLQGEDEAAVRTLFDVPTRSWFTARGGRNFHFEAAGTSLLFHTGKRVPAEQIRALMEQALEVKRLLAGDASA